MAASEETHKPTIVGVDGNVLITFPNDVYLRMTAPMAREFARQILAAAAKSEGQTGYQFIIDATEPEKSPK